MPRSAVDYQPRDAEHAVLHRVIDEHLEAFLEAARRHADGCSLPEFVEQEFREFLTCGVLAHGFARLRCTDCALERLVPFSCKGRGFCPSCGGRRMTEGAARLVDAVLAGERDHSITCSARSSSEGGMVSPSDLAVLRLMTSSNLVGRSTGRSSCMGKMALAG